MYYRLARCVALILVTVLMTTAPQASAKERSEVEDKYKWDLSGLYPTINEFQAEKDSFLADAEKLTAFKGKLDASPGRLKDALDLYYSLEKRMRRMESYAGRLADQDTRVSENKAHESEVENVRARFNALSSFIDPEVVALGEKKLDKFLKSEPGLAVYAFPLRETLRQQRHILSDKEEAILAAAQNIAYAGYSGYSLFTDADMPRRTITLQDGTEIKIDYANFDKTRRSLVQEDRVAAFDAYFGPFSEYQRTLADLLFQQIKVHKFYADMRGYESTLAAALDGNNIDTAIYTSLIKAAHRNLPTFHRYLKLKARALGKQKLDYTDMYVPFTTGVEIEVAYDEATAMLVAALAPLGDKYVGTIAGAFAGRWIDVYPGEGKRSGAYSSGWAYGVHPYILMNYNDTYSNALTLAHEMGHAMHSYLSNGAQPFPTASYATFVAEVASTFNENLLNDYMFKKVASDEERLYLLGNFLDGSIKGTFFRQIQFAEFELLIHQKVENGEALTDEVLGELYLDLTRKYYGHDEGVVDVPEMIAVEWAAVPHFYYDYYVFQYSTSIAAASLLSERVIEGEDGALDRYMANLLQAGGSDNPVALLKKAGADMTKPEAYNALVARANRYMDEMEKILDRMGK